MDFIIRDPEATDANFITSVMVRQLLSQVRAKDSTTAAFFIRAGLALIIAQSDILIAAVPEHPELIMSFIVGAPDTNTLFYLYTKEVYRRHHIAAALVESMFGTDASPEHAFSTPLTSSLPGIWNSRVLRPLTGGTR